MQKLRLLFGIILFLTVANLPAQIYFQLVETGTNKWSVQAVMDDAVFPSNLTIAGTGQVTILTPLGIGINNLTYSGGIWNNSGVVNGPVENPAFTYTSIGLVSGSGLILQNGTPTTLFSFELNNNPNLEFFPTLICSSDPFIIFPNSINSNPGNELTVFDPVDGAIYQFAGVVDGCDGQDVPKVFGAALYDATDDCLENEGAFPLVGWKVVATTDLGSENSTFTNHLGQYFLLIPEYGAHVTLIPPTGLWSACLDGSEITYPSATIHNLLAKTPVKCPQMTVDVQSFATRRCTTNVYYMNWCNKGTALAEAAYIIFKPDAALTFQEATIGHETLADGSLKFALGDVEIGDCGYLYVTFQSSCDIQLGQTLCVEANIYPDGLCLDNSTVYEGPNIHVDGSCSGDMVAFEIANTGSTAMGSPSEYKVIKDGVMFETGFFQLDGNATQQLSYPADGATYRLEAKQVDEFPIATSPSKTIETCSANGGSFSTGYVMQFPFADYGHTHDQHCGLVIGSFDPNDKRGFPLGFGPQHKIEPNTPLEYMIRFQNTGTDTAFKVVILDTLTESLNIESIEPGASSHAYRLAILDNKVLEFTFEDIMLPDSNVNEPASHGFVAFNIRQQADLPLGSAINNTAAIYFDINEPVITNTASHLVAHDFIEVSGTKNVNDDALALQIFPNPSQNIVNFQLGNSSFRTGQLELYNSVGQRLRSLHFDGTTFSLLRNNLPAGVYFYSLRLDGYQAANGKIEFRD